jgi:hypothetical protein
MAVRHVERLPLGTAYMGVVERVKQIMGSPALAGDRSLTVDGTGVGAPVVEMLKGARLGCEVCEVTITGGEHANRGTDGWNVPKQDLVDGVRILLERRLLRFAKDLKHGRMLMRELMDMQHREQRSGGVRVGADGYGQHDDMVIALALACWKAKFYRDRFIPQVRLF